MALPLFAQTDLAVEPRSPGVWESLHAAPGLELRDAQGRLISRDALGGEVAEGARRVRRQGAELSGLPRKAAWLDRLERLSHLLSSLRGGSTSDPPAKAEALAPAPGPKAVAPDCGFRRLAAPPDSRVALSPLQLTYEPGRVTPQALRL